MRASGSFALCALLVTAGGLVACQGIEPSGSAIVMTPAVPFLNSEVDSALRSVREARGALPDGVAEVREALDEAVELATCSPRAFPWHHNLLSLREGRLLSLEVMPDHHDVEEVEGGFVHTNHLVHPAMCGAAAGERSAS